MRFLAASDQPIYLDGLTAVLKSIGSAGGELAVATLHEVDSVVSQNGSFDLVLLDLPMPPSSLHFNLLTNLRDGTNSGAILVLADRDHPAVYRQLMDMGVRGVVPKAYSADMIVNILRLVLAGGRFVPDSALAQNGSEFNEAAADYVAPELGRLTRRQREVLRELGQGLSNNDIANRLGIAVATVKLHVNAILQELKLRNRTEAAIFAHRAGLIPDSRG